MHSCWNFERPYAQLEWHTYVGTLMNTANTFFVYVVYFAIIVSENSVNIQLRQHASAIH